MSAELEVPDESVLSIYRLTQEGTSNAHEWVRVIAAPVVAAYVRGLAETAVACGQLGTAQWLRDEADELDGGAS